MERSFATAFSSFSLATKPDMTSLVRSYFLNKKSDIVINLKNKNNNFYLYRGKYQNFLQFSLRILKDNKVAHT